jgi:hypothetical protein
MTVDRKADTWNKAMEGALNGLPVNVIQSTSDEGASLLKHTKESLGAAHSPDLYHVVQDIGRSGSAALKVKEKSCRKELDTITEKRIKKAIKVNSSSAETFEEETEKQRLEKLQKEEQQALQELYQAQQKTDDFNEGRRAVGLNYHPYDLQNGLRQSPEKIESLLIKNMLQCKNAIVDLGENAHAKLAKAMRLIPSMKATLIFYFTMTAKKLDELNFDFTARGLIEDELMPAAYLKIAAKKEKNKKKSESLLALANEKLSDFKRRSGPYSRYSQKELNKMNDAACENVQIFQRSSSCVEGRNAQLKLKYHNLHRLTDSKLKALTVIHNFHIKRSDGTTPAQRFFKQSHDSLFETIIKKIPELSRPRKRQRKIA